MLHRISAKSSTNHYVLTYTVWFFDSISISNIALIRIAILHFEIFSSPISKMKINFFKRVPLICSLFCNVDSTCSIKVWLKVLIKLSKKNSDQFQSLIRSPILQNVFPPNNNLHSKTKFNYSYDIVLLWLLLTVSTLLNTLLFTERYLTELSSNESI